MGGVVFRLGYGEGTLSGNGRGDIQAGVWRGYIKG